MKSPALLLIALAATGCVQSNDKYPSLALRPIESRSDAEPVVPVATATPDAELDAQIAATGARLNATAATFDSTAEKAKTAAMTPAAKTTGSNQWLTAQSALAEIDGLRGDTLGTVSDIERMVTARGEAGQPPYPALDALHAKAQDQLDAETAKVAAIKALLGEP